MAAPGLCNRGQLLCFRKLFMSEAASKSIQQIIAALVSGASDPAAALRELNALLQSEKQRVRVAEEQFRLLTDALPHITWTMRPDLSIDYLNQQGIEYCGVTVEELARRGWHFQIHPDDLPALMQAITTSMAHGLPSEVEHRFRRHDGVYRRVVSRAVPMKNEAGEVVRWVGTSTDIQDRWEAEQAVREHRQQLALSLEAGRLADWEVNLETGRLNVSPQLRVLFGAGEETLLTREQWASYVLPEDLGPTRKVINEAIAARDRYHVEFRIRRGDGEIRWMTSDSNIKRDEHGKALRMVGVSADITDRKHAEIQMRLAKEAAESANQAKDNFLAVLSHELRTPLTPILSGAQFLESDRSLSPQHHEVATIIRRNAELEARLIDDLLDLTRISRGQLELHFAPVDLHEKIRHIVQMCAPDASLRKVTISSQLDAARHHLNADPARLQQIIWNLLKNAIKFTADGGRVNISTSLEDDDTVQLVVSDTGIGITPDLLPRIFDAFEQGGPEVMRRFGGMGLGLTIAKNLVELHGGRISASSEGPGHGASFMVQLPLTAAATSAAQAEPAGRLRNASCTVLLVEDHADTRRLMMRLLEDFGCTVHVAAGVAEAVAFPADQPLDLLLSDIGLLDGSGLDVVRHIKATRPKCMMIALSGYGMEADRQRSLEAGFDLHLTKPVDLRKLEQVLRQLRKN